MLNDATKSQDICIKRSTMTTPAESSRNVRLHLHIATSNIPFYLTPQNNLHISKFPQDDFYHFLHLIYYSIEADFVIVWESIDEC